MDAISILVAAVVGVIVGGGGVWLLLRGKHGEGDSLRQRIEELVGERSRAESEATNRADRIVSLENELNSRDIELRDTRGELVELRVEFAKIISETDERERSFQARIDELKHMEEKLKETFENLSNEALRKSGEELLKKYREADEHLSKEKKAEIEKMLQPVQSELKRIEEFNRKLDEDRMKDSTLLKDQITELTRGTGKLISALQGSGSAGRWGEVQLKRIIELAGLQEGRDYVQQASLMGVEGTLRPDMQVFLPGGKTMIIDSKVPIQDLDSLEALDEDGRKNLSVGIANRVMEYAKGLHRRDYSQLESAPDFVVMFIASESAFRMAVEGRSGLIEEVINLNVVVVTPSTLLPMLKAVNYGWRQEKLAKEAQNIQKWGKDLYDALVVMKAHYDDLGRRINAVGKKYNEFGGSLDSTVIPKARRMAEAGLPVKSEIDENVAVVEFSERELRARDFMNPTEIEQLSLE